MNHDLHYHGPVIALDLDDTLYPEIDYVYSAYRAIADALSRRDEIDAPASLKVMQRAFRIGNNPFDALLDAFPSISRKEMFVPMCVEIYRHHSPQLSLPRESRDFLEDMRKENVKLALVTDGRVTSQRAKIIALGLEEFFHPDDIWISGERGIGKLAPDPWRHLVDRYPEANRFVAIGDNPTKDFLYPNMLGFTTICLKDKGNNVHSQELIPSDAHRPAHSVDSLAEAKSIIF